MSGPFKMKYTSSAFPFKSPLKNVEDVSDHLHSRQQILQTLKTGNVETENQENIEESIDNSDLEGKVKQEQAAAGDQRNARGTSWFERIFRG